MNKKIGTSKKYYQNKIRKTPYKLKKSSGDIISKYNILKKKLTGCYFFTVKFCISISLIIVVVQSLAEVFDDKVVFQSFDIPEILEQKGYTDKMIIEQLADRINFIREEVRKSDQEKFIKIIAIEEKTEIEMPGTGISLTDLTDFIRNFLNTDIRSVSGNLIISENSKMQLFVRITDKPTGIFTGDMDKIIYSAAEHILKNLDPFTLGKYYSIQKNIPAMQQLAKYVLENQSDSQETAIAYLIEGLSFFDRQKYEEALQEWEFASKKDPSNINAFVYQGWALDELGRFEQAIEKYRKVTEIDSDNACAYNNWAITLYRTGKVEQAIDKFKMLIKLAPDYPHAYNNMGYLLFELNQFQQGIDYIKKAISLDPKEPGFYDSLAEGFFSTGEYEKCIAELKNLLRLDPQNTRAYRLSGMALEKLGRIKEAQAMYAKAKKR